MTPKAAWRRPERKLAHALRQGMARIAMPPTPTTSPSGDERVLHVPARTIPVPQSVSAVAQAALAIPLPPPRTWPALDDRDGWRTAIAGTDAMMLATFLRGTTDADVLVEDADFAGVRVFAITPTKPTTKHQVYFYLHGGALVGGGGECCRAMGILAATNAGVRTWAVDYRLPPDHPYPAALDDCIAVYRALLRDHRPEEIVVGGGSAGGNLAAALILRARDEGLPLPAAAVLLSPELDLTESGDTFNTNLGLDNVLIRRLDVFNALYAAGHDLADPYVSPLFGDFTKGFPPTFLQSGTRDMFLSNTVRMHRALRGAGVETELHVFEAMPHGVPPGSPEDSDLNAEVRRFIDAHRPGS